jgi:hypothetical protein
MIKEGYRSKAKDWGNYTALKVARLKEPVKCLSKDKGKALFNPVITKLQWETPPSEDGHEFWFHYWITWSDISDKERYGQYGPMLGEKALLELLQDAINKDFFSDRFLDNLHKAITQKLQK